MTTVTQTKSVDQMTDQELKELLKEREEKARQKEEKERKEYEASRDKNIEALMSEAMELTERLSVFKERCHSVMQQHEVKLNEYGKIRGNSKGGFSITHSNDELRITRRRDTEPSWDERGKKGLELVKEFLHSSLKKRDKELFELLLSFLERNKAGELEYGRVFSLLSHKSKFSDERWTEGLRLLQQSFNHHFRGYGYEFKHKGDGGKWQSLPLNFSSL